jgi:putative acetyltransferase
MKIIFQGKTKTGKEIIVRYPEISDLEQLLNYINTVSDERIFIRYQGEHETLESEKKYLDKKLDEIKNKKSVNLLAVSNGQIVGVSDVKMFDKTEKHIGLFGITIAKDFRGEGIGSLLMDLVLKEAEKELVGLKIITLEVYSTNEIAKKLYSKMGFKEYGFLPGGVSRNNTFEDAVMMYKNI